MRSSGYFYGRKIPRLGLVLVLSLGLLITPGFAENDPASKSNLNSFQSPDWNKAMNQAEQKKLYPNKRKITPETVRLTLNEFYVPQVSEFLNAGVDYFEWLNTLDDPYLNRYKVDLRIDPLDERLKLFWKRQF